MDTMKVNITALQQLAKDKEWSIPELANRLGLDYSYFFRILNGERSGGGKLFGGLYRLCKEENLNVDDYIFLTKPLSANNGLRKTGTTS